jgi:hypothetical protein
MKKMKHLSWSGMAITQLPSPENAHSLNSLPATQRKHPGRIPPVTTTYVYYFYETDFSLHF